MRFMYLHKILGRETDHWTKKMLVHLQTQNLGWAKNIEQKLNIYKLETNWDVIRQKTKENGKRTVTEAVDKVNKEKLIQFCVPTTATTENAKINTKTKNVHKDLHTSTTQRDYKRK